MPSFSKKPRTASCRNPSAGPPKTASNSGHSVTLRGVSGPMGARPRKAGTPVRKLGAGGGEDVHRVDAGRQPAGHRGVLTGA